MEGTHDDDELGFIQLAAVTANVIRFLKTQKKEGIERERQTHSGNSDEQKCEKDRHNVDHTLNEKVALRE